jgi:hypothetical protein
MRFASRTWWTGGILSFAVGVCWLIVSMFPDRVFSAYLEIKRWVTAAGPVQTLPRPVPSGGDAVRDFHEDTSPKPFVVLPISATAGWIRGRGWEPTDSDIAGLEASLPLLPHLTAENRLAVGDVHIDPPEQYFRQYVPFVRNGKKLIYVNGFRSVDATSYWRHRLVVILDGGIRNWQAFYDPAAHAFLTLRINCEA